MIAPGRWAGLFLGVALILFPSCSRQPGLLSPSAGAQSNALPFDNASHSEGISPTQAFASTSIPAGTAIVVRLQSALSSADAHTGEQFQTVLEEPILVQGQTLAPSGVAITGRVLATKSSEPREPGYLRLTLSSIVLNDKAVDVHTSSIFAKGGPWVHARARAKADLSSEPSHSAGINDVQFSTGRRLTFRLIDPLPLQR